MIKVTLKDGSVKEFESGITAMEVAKTSAWVFIRLPA